MSIERYAKGGSSHEESDIMDLIYMSEPNEMQSVWKKIILYNYNIHICDGVKDVELQSSKYRGYSPSDNAYWVPSYNIKKFIQDLKCETCGKFLIL